MASVWHAGQLDELRKGVSPLHAGDGDGCGYSVGSTRTGVWLIVEWGTRAQTAFRVAFSPGELDVVDLSVERDGFGVDLRMRSTIGRQRATIRIDPADGTFSAATTLETESELSFPGWPRDIFPDLVPGTEGTVHTSQRGLRTGLVHASLAPGRGSFMYLQDLTMLGDFCDATHASAGDTVGGAWPDLGFALPCGSEPLRTGECLVSSWHLAVTDKVPADAVEVADQYLALLARLYMHIDRPTPSYVDWRERADASRADLDECEDCWMTVDDTRYLRAYVGDDHPPESMVQLAVALPLIERSTWRQEADPLADELAGLTPRFHDHRTSSIARWLPDAEDMLDGGEPHEKPRVMDSWYLLHPMLNLARLAARSDDGARELLLRSLDREIEVARHFRYEWPVFYDVDTLEVIKAESEPGKGGELDVPGLYAHVMLQAFELTDDDRYLHEASAAARTLHGKGFELAYQMNNVAFGMVALLRLFQLTGESDMLNISRVLCACLFDNVGLWSTRYGKARDRASFFGVFPMPKTWYTAAYEQAEVSAACLEYLLRAGEELPPALRVLLPELIRHVTAKLDTYYPPNLAPDALAESPKTGHLAPELWIPVEDLADGWDPAGAVGQEVYGAGIAFSTLARSYVRVPDRTAQVYCEYPFEELTQSRHEVRIRILGDPRCECRVRVIADDEICGLASVIGSVSGKIEATTSDVGWCDYMVRPGQELTVHFLEERHRQPPGGAQRS